MRKIAGDVGCLSLLVFIAGLFFYPTLVGGKLPVPTDALIGLYHPWRDFYADTNPRGVPFKNFLITDPVRQQIPWRKIAIDQWKVGHLPLWNPYNFSGTPLSANIQAAVFYPGNILFFLFDFPLAWTILIMLQPLLAGFFFYLYTRHLGLSRLASLFGATAWSFSGFSIAWLTWGTMVHVALWIPLILLSIDKLLENKFSLSNKTTLVWLTVFIGALAAQFFAGHAQISFYVVGLSLFYGVGKLWRSSMPVKKYIALGLGIFGAILITSGQWGPMLQLLRESGRIVESSNWLNPGWFLPWQHLVQFVAPDFFGNPATGNYWGEWNYGEFVGYIGILPLMFALYALAWHKDAYIKFWIGVGLVVLVFMLPTPVAKLPYILQIPFLSSLQPTRLMVLLDFSLVMLASLGLNLWLSRRDRKLWFMVGGAFIVFVLLWGLVSLGRLAATETLKSNLLVSRRNLILPTALLVVGVGWLSASLIIKKIKITQSLVVVGFVAIAAVDLLRFGWKFTPFTPRSYFYPETRTIAFLKKQPKPFRITSLDKRVLPPNVTSFWGIETIEGYDPLYSRRYEEFLAAGERGRPDITPPFGFNRIITAENLDSALLSLLNVRYILTLTDVSRPNFAKVFQEGQTRVYENTKSLPRVFPVEEVHEVQGKQAALDALFDASFNARKTALVEEPIRLLSHPLQAGDAVTIENYDVNSMTVKTEFSNIRFLVVGNSYHSGWRALIDGIPTKLYRTDYALMGLAVPEGLHEVKLRYE